MDAATWQAICAAFDELVDLAPAARDEALIRLAVTDPAVHTAVRTLLAHDGIASQQVGPLEDVLPPASSAPPHDPLVVVGTEVAHFRIEALIATGGMGAVYRATDVRLDRPVALKLPLPGQALTAEARARFLREGRAAGRLQHPHLCTVHEVGESDSGQLYLAMAYYEGETLRQRLDRVGRLRWPEAVGIASQVSSGLAAAHAAGIVHRDLKPANIMLLPDGGLRILDFGLARVQDATQSIGGAALGTAAYMAPEQVRGDPLDHHADLWSLGVLLHEMLTGARPFGGAHAVAMAHAVLHDAAPPVRRLVPDVPWRLEALVLGLLQKSIGQRPPSADAVAAELSAIAAGTAPPLATRLRSEAVRFARRSRAVLTVGMLAGAAALGLYALTPPARSLTDASPDPDGTLLLTPRDARAAAHFALGLAYERRVPNSENLRFARAQYREVLAIEPGFAPAHARLALTMSAIADRRLELDASLMAGARAAAETALRLQPRLPVGHLALGRVLMLEGNPEGARQELERAAAGMPTSAEPQIAIGEIARDAGDWYAAVERFTRASALDQSSAEAFSQLAMTFSRLRRFPECILAWDRALMLRPDDRYGALIRAYAFLRWTGSVDTLAATLDRLPPEWDELGRATMARVTVERFRGRSQTALGLLDRMRLAAVNDALYFRPRSLLRGQLLADLGDSLQARAQFADALRQLDDSVAAHPADLRFRIARGESSAGAGRQADARADAEHVLAVIADEGRALQATAMRAGVAEIYARAGMPQSAIAQLRILLRMPAAGREATLPMLLADPTWEPLRRYPEFQELLRMPQPRPLPVPSDAAPFDWQPRW